MKLLAKKVVGRSNYTIYLGAIYMYSGDHYVLTVTFSIVTSDRTNRKREREMINL